MCGIVGIVHREATPDSGSLAAALDTLKLRGPDDSGMWQDEHVALGHRRLSIVGVRRGRQPISSPDGMITIVVNGEFYDYQRLRQELSSAYTFQTDTDSELLIPLYQKYGYVAMMEHLRGEFAFLLYDKRKRLLVAGRDRFGIKPLCWWDDGKRLIIASKAKAIHACGVKAEWDEYSLMQALSIQYQPTDRTFFKGVRQLEPGHLLVLNDGCKKKDITYWDMSYPVASDEPALTYAQEQQHIDEFHELLLHSIQLRLQGDVPACCHLSGGLDSSAIAGIMAHLTGEPVHCFSIVFPKADAEYDENGFATETAEHCGAVLHRVEVSQHDILRHLPEAVYHSEGLAVNGHLSCKYLLNKSIHEAGFKVALTGEGADECLAGYPHLRKDLFATLPAKEQEALTRQLYHTNLAITGTEIAVGDTLCCDSLVEHLGFVPSFLAAKAGIGHKMYNYLDSDMLHCCRSHDFLREMSYHHQIETKLPGLHPVNQSLYLWNKHALCNYILGTLGDGCEMSASVEGRLPFLDHHLFEHAAHLPMQMKIRDHVNEKYVLKEAARPYITDRVYRRQKHPFQAPPLTRFFGKSEYEQIYDELTSDSLMTMGVFNRDAITALLESLPSMSILGQTVYEPVVMLMLTIFHMNQKLMN
ncbi:MAG: asparagine synthase (glutamine-hydrolyzing) [Prevotella sp.]|nr:asparagine synthase (glutamine-hydrolyzing) [Prevotella sp.]MBR6264125.1 asparagine synthase (glutamine-hydrolyzing) [Prevotella sp.]